MANGGLRRLFKRESSTEDEIKQLLVEDDEGEIQLSAREMINNIFDFDDTTAGDIMTHRTDIVVVEDTASLIDVAKASIDEGCSRIPVFHEDLDNILGIIYVKDLLKFIGTEISKDENLKDYIREPLFVPETIPCGKLFEKMTETRIQLAIVVDEYGGTAGLVTLEDILEELVGDIEDAEDALNIKFPEGDYDTLAGFVISRLGFVPGTVDESTQLTFENITFTILKVEDRRIESIKAEIKG